MKTGKIFLTLLLLAAVAGALALMKQNQDTRRGAAVAGANMSIVPAAKQLKRPGEELKYNVNFVLDNTNARVEAAQVKLCYSNHIEFKSVIGNKNAGFDAEAIAAVTKAADGDRICTTVAFGSNGVTSDQLNKLKNAGSIFEITFIAKTVTGGVKSISIDTADGVTVLGAYNPASADKTITVRNVAGGQYEVTDGSTPSPTGSSPIPSGQPSVTPVCRFVWRIMRDGNWLDASTKAAKTGSVRGSGEPYCKEVKVCSGDNQLMVIGQDYNTKEECEAALGGNTGNAPVLNYKVSYRGVLPNDHKCMVDWPMQVIVLSRGTTKVYSNVIPNEVIDEAKKVVLKGSLTLTGFNYTDQVAVFFKGPKHLQMKYGVQNQSKNYNKAGGELVLTRDEKTSPWYDFSEHPMLPGDVVGKYVETIIGCREPPCTHREDSPQDGDINILDFSYVKSVVAKLETVPAGQNLKADLNGNCQANSADLYLLSRSLEDKQGQLY